jgi:hypothetical protein
LARRAGGPPGRPCASRAGPRALPGRMAGRPGHVGGTEPLRPRLAWHLREREVAFSLGMQVDQHVREAVLAQPERAWTPAVDPDGQVRHGAEVCGLSGWLTLAASRRAPARPAAGRTPTPARSCASPTLTATASRSSSPTNPTATWAGWSCATASAPASRTASAPPRPLAWPTSPSTGGGATRSGSSWSWPPRTSPASPRRCCWTARSQSPSPRRCATGCCMWPPGWSATPAASSCGCSAPGPGQPSWPRRSPAYGRCHCAAEARSYHAMPGRQRWPGWHARSACDSHRAAPPPHHDHADPANPVAVDGDHPAADAPVHPQRAPRTPREN